MFASGKNKLGADENPLEAGFLQSKHWKNFQENIGRSVKTLNLERFRALMIFYGLPIAGGYFFVPRGPLFQNSKFKTRNSKKNKDQIQIQNIQECLDKMMDVAKDEKAGWVRVEPLSEDDLNVIKNTVGKEYRIYKSKKDHEPAQTLILDLSASLDEILAQMKQKTRYNIRLSARKNVEIFCSRNPEHVDTFIQLTRETAKRDNITPHPDWYYRKMVETIPQEVLQLYFAKYEGKIISATMVCFHGGLATYLHGASDNFHRNVMAPYGLQWKAIRDAKEKGCKGYDFGGTKLILKPKAERKKNGKEKEEWIPEKGSWQGITKFKQGFCPGCQPVEYPGCWDIVVDWKKYKIYSTLQFFKDAFRAIAK